MNIIYFACATVLSARTNNIERTGTVVYRGTLNMKTRTYSHRCHVRSSVLAPMPRTTDTRPHIRGVTPLFFYRVFFVKVVATPLSSAFLFRT